MRGAPDTIDFDVGHVLAPPAVRCTVVLCTRHREREAIRCLQAVRRLDYPDLEVVVVDNSAGLPGLRSAAAAAGARYVVEPRPGLSRSRNVGGRLASGEVVAFLDDDSPPDPAWVDRLAAAFEDLGVVAATGRVRVADPESEGGRAYMAFGAEDLGPYPFRLTQTDPDWFERANFGGVGVGPSIAFRAKLFAQGWGFREDLGPPAGIAGEENYAFFDLLRAGHAIAYVPDAVVFHEPPADRARLAARARRILRGSTAYVIMLLVEEPGYRRRVLRYAFRALGNQRRPWRPPAPAGTLFSRREILVATATAPWSYFRWRLRRRRLLAG